MEQEYMENLQAAEPVQAPPPAEETTLPEQETEIIPEAGADGAELPAEETGEAAEGSSETVSGNSTDSDTVSTVSGNVVVDNYVDYSLLLADMYAEVQTLKKEEPTIWEKPLEEYTVTEGLLLLAVVLLLAIFTGKIFRKGERYV